MVAQPIDKDWSWACAAGSAVTFFCLTGTFRTSGILFVEILDVFGASTSLTAVMVGIQMAFMGLSAPFVAILGTKYSYRAVGMVGGICYCLGHVLVAVAPNIYFVVIVYGSLAGTGLSLSFGATSMVLSQYFQRRHSLASGIAFAGGSLGTLILPQILSVLEKEYDWRGLFLIYGGLTLHIVASAALFRPPSFYQIRVLAPRTGVSSPNCGINLSSEENASINALSLQDRKADHGEAWMKGENASSNVSLAPVTTGGRLSALANSGDQQPALLSPRRLDVTNATSRGLDNRGFESDNVTARDGTHVTYDVTKEVDLTGNIEQKSDKESKPNASLIGPMRGTTLDSSRDACIKTEKVSPNNCVGVDKDVDKGGTGEIIHETAPSKAANSITLQPAALLRQHPVITIESQLPNSAKSSHKSRSIFRYLDFRILCDPTFAIFGCAMVIAMIAYNDVYIFLPPHADNVGIPKDTVSLILSMSGILDFVCRLLSGWLGTRECVSCNVLLGVNLLVPAIVLPIALFLLPPLAGFITMMAAMSGSATALMVLYPVVLKGITGLTRFPTGIAVTQFTVGIVNAWIPSVFGFIRDTTGTYAIPLILCALMLGIGGLGSLLSRCAPTCSKQRTDNNDVTDTYITHL